ncbi:hypothetical protein L873DRAFT_441271, partial [Choiromyces venosus 120613-1]
PYLALIRKKKTITLPYKSPPAAKFPSNPKEQLPFFIVRSHSPDMHNPPVSVTFFFRYTSGSASPVSPSTPSLSISNT